MVKKNCIFTLIGIIMLGIFAGCGSKNANTTKENRKTIAENKNMEELDVEYAKNSDGTYTCDGNIYQYKMEIVGKVGESSSTFLVLTNDKSIKFDTLYESMISDKMSSEYSNFRIIGWH